MWVDVISKNQNGTYLDAAYLITRNRDLIAHQALADTFANYPTFTLSNANERKCIRDIRIVINGLVKDLVFGGNEGIVGVADAYFTGTVLTGLPEAQRDETVFAFQRVKQYCMDAMRNWSGGDVDEVSPTGSTYNPASGALTVSFPDPPVAPTTSDRIAFKEEGQLHTAAHIIV